MTQHKTLLDDAVVVENVLGQLRVRIATSTTLQTPRTDSITKITVTLATIPDRYPF